MPGERRSALPASLPPRGLSHAQAAEYLGVSVGWFDQNIRPHVPPIEIGTKRLWDRKALDRFLDQRDPNGDAFRSVDSWLEALGDDRENPRR